MRVAFRADGGGQGLGVGHLMRCLAIAEALLQRGIHCWFVSKNFLAGIQLICEHGYEVKTLPANVSESDSFPMSLLLLKDADVVVIDSYSVTEDYFSLLAKNGKRVVYLDDLLDRFLSVDLVIGNAYAAKHDYEPLISSHTQVLCGPQYIPLRSFFQQATKKNISPRIQKVLITCGGEDPQNATEHLVNALNAYPQKLHLTILLGIAYPFHDQLKACLIHSKHSVEVQRNVRNVHDLYQQVDMAITASGSTIWELTAIGTPMILIQTAQNQEKNIQFMQNNHFALALGWYHTLSPQFLCKALDEMQDPEIRATYSKACHSLVDGKGAIRIAEAISKLKDETISFRSPSHDLDSKDSQLVWTWRNDPITRAMSKNSNPILWENHQNWYENILKIPSSTLLIVIKNQQPIGVIRFDKLDSATAEIHINLDPQKRNKGLGKLVLQAACAYAYSHLNILEILAKIKPENVASIKAFEAAGFSLQESKEGFLLYAYKRE